MRRSRLALATAVLLGMGGGCGGETPPGGPADPARPSPSARPAVPTSLVIVDLSGVRSDEVTPPGDAVPTSSKIPSFRALASEGTFFSNAAASGSWDLPSVGTLFSGCIPSECTLRGMPSDGPSMIPSVETIAEVLRDAGYATGAFTAGGRISKTFRIDQGFGTWEEIEGDVARLARAKAWLATLSPSTPRLLFLHASAASTPTTRARRLGELDEFLREARALVGGAKADAGTWFVALSDHGDVLDPKEGVAATGEAAFYDTQILVPLAIVGPGVPVGVRAGSVGLVDLFPSTVERLGLPARSAIEGRSWARVLDGTNPAGRPVRFEAWRKMSLATGPTVVRYGGFRGIGFKFVASYDESTGVAAEETYDLVADPREATWRPATTANGRGPEIDAALAAIRAELRRGERLHADPVTAGYFHGD